MKEILNKKLNSYCLFEVSSARASSMGVINSTKLIGLKVKLLASEADRERRFKFLDSSFYVY